MYRRTVTVITNGINDHLGITVRSKEIMYLKQ